MGFELLHERGLFCIKKKEVYLWPIMSVFRPVTQYTQMQTLRKEKKKNHDDIWQVIIISFLLSLVTNEVS